MTEQDWLQETDPTELLLHVRLRRKPRANARQYRLLGCACARHIGQLLSDEGRYGEIIAGVERYCASGDADELKTARNLVVELQHTFESLEGSTRLWATNSSYRIGTLLERVRRADRPRFLAVVALRALTTSIQSRSEVRQSGKIARWVIDYAGMAMRHVSRGDDSERSFHVAAIRDIFGNPFRTIEINPSWLTWRDGVVPALARAAYEERPHADGLLDPTRLQILADALEEAGCGDPALLGHLRAPESVHVRGCRIVDLLMGI